MGIQKLYSKKYEINKSLKKELILHYKKLDKKSVKVEDLIKRIEVIEKILELDDK